MARYIATMSTERREAFELEAAQIRARIHYQKIRSARKTNPDIQRRCQSLISEILTSETQCANVLQLSGEEAQIMLDFLDVVCFSVSLSYSAS